MMLRSPQLKVVVAITLTILFCTIIDRSQRHVIEASSPVAEVAPALQLTDEVLKRVTKLKQEAADCPVEWGAPFDYYKNGRSGEFYLAKMFRAGLPKDLSQKDLVRVIAFCLKSSDESLHRSAFDLCRGINDVKVISEVATKEALCLPAFRKVMIERLHALLKISSEGATKDGIKILAGLADAYISDPQQSHADDLDRAIRDLMSEKCIRTEDFVWFLAAASCSGSQIATQELVTLYSSPALPSQDLYYLHEAAQRRQFNCVVGGIIAKQAGKNSVLRSGAANFPGALWVVLPR